MISSSIYGYYKFNNQQSQKNADDNVIIIMKNSSTHQKDVAMVVKKQSESGIFQNQRALLIQSGFISYFSKVPKGFSGDVHSLSGSEQFPKMTLCASNIQNIQRKVKDIHMKFNKKNLINNQKFKGLINEKIQQSEAYSGAEGSQQWTFKCDDSATAQAFVQQILLCKNDPTFKPSLKNLIKSYQEAKNIKLGNRTGSMMIGNFSKSNLSQRLSSPTRLDSRKNHDDLQKPLKKQQNQKNNKKSGIIKEEPQEQQKEEKKQIKNSQKNIDLPPGFYVPKESYKQEALRNKILRSQKNSHKGQQNKVIQEIKPVQLPKENAIRKQQIQQKIVEKDQKMRIVQKSARKQNNLARLIRQKKTTQVIQKQPKIQNNLQEQQKKRIQLERIQIEKGQIQKKKRDIEEREKEKQVKEQKQKQRIARQEKQKKQKQEREREKKEREQKEKKEKQEREKDEKLRNQEYTRVAQSQKQKEQKDQQLKNNGGVKVLKKVSMAQMKKRKRLQSVVSENQKMQNLRKDSLKQQEEDFIKKQLPKIVSQLIQIRQQHPIQKNQQKNEEHQEKDEIKGQVVKIEEQKKQEPKIQIQIVKKIQQKTEQNQKPMNEIENKNIESKEQKKQQEKQQKKDQKKQQEQVIDNKQKKEDLNLEQKKAENNEAKQNEIEKQVKQDVKQKIQDKIEQKKQSQIRAQQIKVEQNKSVEEMSSQRVKQQKKQQTKQQTKEEIIDKINVQEKKIEEKQINKEVIQVLEQNNTLVEAKKQEIENKDQKGESQSKQENKIVPQIEKQKINNIPQMQDKQKKEIVQSQKIQELPSAKEQNLQVQPQIQNKQNIVQQQKQPQKPQVQVPIQKKQTQKVEDKTQQAIQQKIQQIVNKVMQEIVEKVEEKILEKKEEILKETQTKEEVSQIKQNKNPQQIKEILQYLLQLTFKAKQTQKQQKNEVQSVKQIHIQIKELQEKKQQIKEEEIKPKQNQTQKKLEVKEQPFSFLLIDDPIPVQIIQQNSQKKIEQSVKKQEDKQQVKIQAKQVAKEESKEEIQVKKQEDKQKEQQKVFQFILTKEPIIVQEKKVDIVEVMTSEKKQQEVKTQVQQIQKKQIKKEQQLKGQIEQKKIQSEQVKEVRKKSIKQQRQIETSDKQDKQMQEEQKIDIKNEQIIHKEDLLDQIDNNGNQIPNISIEQPKEIKKQCQLSIKVQEKQQQPQIKKVQQIQIQIKVEEQKINKIKQETKIQDKQKAPQLKQPEKQKQSSQKKQQQIQKEIEKEKEKQKQKQIEIEKEKEKQKQKQKQKDIEKEIEKEKEKEKELDISINTKKDKQEDKQVEKKVDKEVVIEQIKIESTKVQQEKQIKSQKQDQQRNRKIRQSYELKQVVFRNSLDLDLISFGNISLAQSQSTTPRFWDIHEQNIEKASPQMDPQLSNELKKESSIKTEPNIHIYFQDENQREMYKKKKVWGDFSVEAWINNYISKILYKKNFKSTPINNDLRKLIAVHTSLMKCDNIPLPAILELLGIYKKNRLKQLAVNIMISEIDEENSQELDVDVCQNIMFGTRIKVKGWCLYIFRNVQHYLRVCQFYTYAQSMIHTYQLRNNMRMVKAFSLSYKGIFAIFIENPQKSYKTLPSIVTKFLNKIMRRDQFEQIHREVKVEQDEQSNKLIISVNPDYLENWQNLKGSKNAKILGNLDNDLNISVSSSLNTTANTTINTSYNLCPTYEQVTNKQNAMRKVEQNLFIDEDLKSLDVQTIPVLIQELWENYLSAKEEEDLGKMYQLVNINNQISRYFSINAHHQPKITKNEDMYENNLKVICGCQIFQITEGNPNIYEGFIDKMMNNFYANLANGQKDKAANSVFCNGLRLLAQADIQRSQPPKITQYLSAFITAAQLYLHENRIRQAEEICSYALQIVLGEETTMSLIELKRPFVSIKDNKNKEINLTKQQWYKNISLSQFLYAALLILFECKMRFLQSKRIEIINKYQEKEKQKQKEKEKELEKKKQNEKQKQKQKQKEKEKEKEKEKQQIKEEAVDKDKREKQKQKDQEKQRQKEKEKQKQKQQQKQKQKEKDRQSRQKMYKKYNYKITTQIYQRILSLISEINKIVINPNKKQIKIFYEMILHEIYANYVILQTEETVQGIPEARQYAYGCLRELLVLQEMEKDMQDNGIDQNIGINSQLLANMDKVSLIIVLNYVDCLIKAQMYQNALQIIKQHIDRYSNKTNKAGNQLVTQLLCRYDICTVKTSSSELILPICFNFMTYLEYYLNCYTESRIIRIENLSSSKENKYAYNPGEKCKAVQTNLSLIKYISTLFCQYFAYNDEQLCSLMMSTLTKYVSRAETVQIMREGMVKLQSGVRKRMQYKMNI